MKQPLKVPMLLFHCNQRQSRKQDRQKLTKKKHKHTLLVTAIHLQPRGNTDPLPRLGGADSHPSFSHLGTNKPSTGWRSPSNDMNSSTSSAKSRFPFWILSSPWAPVSQKGSDTRQHPVKIQPWPSFFSYRNQRAHSNDSHRFIDRETREDEIKLPELSQRTCNGKELVCFPTTWVETTLNQRFHNQSVSHFQHPGREFTRKA